MHPLRQFIASYVRLSDDDWSQISPCLVQQELPKDVRLLNKGQVCRHLYFLESGLLRFFIQRDGDEVTKYFTDVPYMFLFRQRLTVWA